MKRLVVVTDLDGTLLDARTYSFAAALPALRVIREKDIPLVICSSKTRGEIEDFRGRIGNRDPFISENGGGIFIPEGYFDLAALGTRYTRTAEGGYQVIRLGAEYPLLRKELKELQAEGFRIKGFGDMSPGEIAGITGMTVAESEMAKERDFDEPFIFTDDGSAMQELIRAIGARGLHWTQGKFLHLIGRSDKGQAVSVVIDLYREKFGEVITVAAGDGPNDIPMFERVDHPIVVRRPDGGYEPAATFPNVIRSNGVGPEGWNSAVLEIIKTLQL